MRCVNLSGARVVPQFELPVSTLVRRLMALPSPAVEDVPRRPPAAALRPIRSLAQSGRSLRSGRAGKGATRATPAIQVRRADAPCFFDLCRRLAAPSSAPPGREPMCAYCAVMPPSITSSEPVTQDDSSDARNSTPLAISSAVPSRPIGVRSSSAWRTAGSLKRCSVSGVSA